MADLITFTLYDPDGRALDTAESNWNETADDIESLIALSRIYFHRFMDMRALALKTDRELRDSYGDGGGTVVAELPEWYTITMTVQP